MSFLSTFQILELKCFVYVHFTCTFSPEILFEFLLLHFIFTTCNLISSHFSPYMYLPKKDAIISLMYLHAFSTFFIAEFEQ